MTFIAGSVLTGWMVEGSDANEESHTLGSPTVSPPHTANEQVGALDVRAGTPFGEAAREAWERAVGERLLQRDARRESRMLPVPTVSSEQPNMGGAVDVRAAFIVGYRAGNGRPEWLEAFLLTIGGSGVCQNGESGWNPHAVSPLGHKGLLQWADSTWATPASATGHWDVWSPYDNGVNAAWMSNNDAPARHWSCWPW